MQRNNTKGVCPLGFVIGDFGIERIKEERHLDQYYLFQYYSVWGMGTNTDTALLSEANLRRIIELELQKKRSGEMRFDDRMTGTWTDEVFCDSSDMEEVIADVIRKRLNTCSTYARVNDLVKFPGETPVETSTEHMDQVIFRLCNQFDFRRDVIAGKAQFFRHIVDLGDEFEKYGLSDRFVDFVSYDMEKVTENHYDYNEDTLIQGLMNRKEHCKKKLEELRNGSRVSASYSAEGRYIDDFIPEMTCSCPRAGLRLALTISPYRSGSRIWNLIESDDCIIIGIGLQ